MSDLLTLEVLSPEKHVLTVETPWVTIPGSEGELGILPEHVPLVTTVDSGILAYEENGQRKQAAVHYGYAQVAADTVTVLTQMVELSGDIDQERADKAEKSAQEKIKIIATAHDDEKAEMNKFEAKLKRALIRQKTAG